LSVFSRIPPFCRITFLSTTIEFTDLFEKLIPALQQIEFIQSFLFSGHPSRKILLPNYECPWFFHFAYNTSVHRRLLIQTFKAEKEKEDKCGSICKWRNFSGCPGVLGFF
jgi:hypothetical protein